MARTTRGLDPRLTGKPEHDQHMVGIDVGRTYAKQTAADASGHRIGTPMQVRTRDFVRAGATELVIQLLEGLSWLPLLGGVTVAGKQGTDGSIVPTNIPELGCIDPIEIYRRTGVKFTLCNDVVAFVLGTTSTGDYVELKSANGPVARSRRSPVRSGLFLTSGTNSARARYVPALDIWVPIAAESGWPGLQPEKGNLMELYFLEHMGLPLGEVGAELMVSLGSGILNWHCVLRDAPEEILGYYLADAHLDRLRPRDLRPHEDFLMELAAADDDDAGPIFDKWALADDPYAGMVMRALCAAQGAYCREVALMDVPDVSEGLWINSPMLVNDAMRNWVTTQTKFLDRFIGHHAVGNGARFVEYLSQLPIYVAKDRYAVPGGAAVNVGVERVINGE